MTTTISDLSGTYDHAALNRLRWPIAWSGAPDIEYEIALGNLCYDALSLLAETPDAVAVEIVIGEIVAVIIPDDDESTL